MSKLSKGDSVAQIVAPISGVVQGFQVDQESGDLLVLVGWTDENGDHSRYFKESEINKTV